jgi:hypothetical protein
MPNVKKEKNVILLTMRSSVVSQKNIETFNVETEGGMMGAAKIRREIFTNWVVEDFAV